MANSYLSEEEVFGTQAAPKKYLSEAEVFGTAAPKAKYVSPEEVGVAPAPAPKESSGFLRQAADLPVSLTKGFVQGVRLIADVFGAGSGVSKAIKGAEDYLGSLMSAQAQNDQREIARIMKEAEDKGVAEQVKAGLRAFSQAPADLVVQGLGTAGPVILATLGTQILGAPVMVARGLGMALGAGMGAGTVKGTIYEETKKALLDAKVPEDQAEARAQLAQSYGGKNLDMILAGTAFGGLTATTGVEKTLVNSMAKRILAKAGIKETTEIAAKETVEAAAKEAAKKTAEAAAKKTLPRRVATGVVTEAAPEAAQAAQEKVAENIALQREGFDVPTFRGVAGAATLEGMLGGVLGGGVSAVSGRPQAKRVVSPPQKEAATVQERTEQLADMLTQLGIPEAEAKIIAENRAKEEFTATQERVGAEVPTTPTGRLEEKIQEFIAAGLAPDEARTRAEAAIAEEDEADAIAEAEAKGEADVARTVGEPSGTSTGVAGEPSTGAPTEGATEAERTGVVPTGPDVGEPAAREGAGAAAVTEGAETDINNVISIVERRQAQIEEQDEAEWEKLEERSVEEARAKLTETYGPQIKALWPVVQRAKKTLRETQYPNSLEAKEAARLIAGFEELIGRFEGIPEVVDVNSERNAFDSALANVPAELKDLDRALTELKTPAPTTGAKRGRPALSPEDKAKREEQRQKAKTTSRQSDAAVSKLNALLDAKLDPDNFENDAAFEAAQTELNNQRAAALRNVLMLEPDVRGSAAGKRAKDALARPEIPAKQLADVKQGVDLARKTPARAEAGAVEAPNEAFKADTNGVQSLGTIIKGKATPALKRIAQRLRGANAGVKFQVVEKDDPLPPVLQKYITDWNASRGLFIRNDATGERSIYVKGSSYGASQGINDITVLHENLHAATYQKLYLGLRAIERGFSENSQLVRATRDLLDIMHRTQDKFVELNRKGQVPPKIAQLYASTDSKILTDPREFLAYGMSDPDFQQFLMGIRGVEEDTSFFTRFVDAVRRLLGFGDEDTNALTDLIVATDKIISARKTPTMYFLERADQRAAQRAEGAEKVAPQAEPKEPEAPRTQKQIEREVAEAKEKVRVSIEGESKTIAKEAKEALKNRDAGKALAILKRLWGSMSASQREATVRLPTMDFLAEWMEKDIPRLKEVSGLIKDMNGMATTFLAGADQLLGSMRRAFKDDPQLQPKLMNLVYSSTLARIDPSNPNAKERSKELDADYEALGESGKAVYKMMREYYRGVHELYRLLLDQQVQNLSGVTQEVKDNILAKIRQAYEKGEAISPYFPLVRRGDYWLAIGEGKQRQFYMFETQAERDAKAQELAEKRGDELEEMLFEKKFEVGNNVNTLRRSSVGRESSQLLTAIFDQIDAQDFMEEGARDGLKDAIYQIYLQTMPEQSFRNMFIHRKGRAGFSTDLLRNTATTASRMSTQLARLKYSPLIRNSMSAARDSIAERPDLLPFVDEMQRRADLALSGQEGGLSQSVAGLANKASYIWYLSSASSALIQPFSILISGVPILSANHGNAVGAAAEIGKAMALVNQYSIFKKNVDGSITKTAPTLANNMNLPADERRAIKEMRRRGVEQSTYSSLVFDYKNNPGAELDSMRSKGAELGRMLVGGLMHNTERLTREVVYIASYRLGRKRGLSFDEAVNQAVADVNEALADYDISNRPRWMQQGIGRVAFQFKMYPLHMMLLLATNFKRMLPLLNKEGKAAAATKFFGIIGATGMLAGVSGLPGFSAMMGVAAWAMKQMADDDDLPEEFKDKDPETYFRNVVLPEKLKELKLGGVPLDEFVSADTVDRGLLNRLTGSDFASRLGLNDMWFRDGKETRTARESAIAFAIDNFGGPSASLALQMVDAYEAFMYGDYQRGLEKAAPSAVRNLLVANKYAEEGIKTAQGRELIAKDNVTAGMLWAQSIGFRPDAVAKVQQNNFKLTAVEQRILFEHDALMKKANIAFKQFQETKDRTRFDKIVRQDIGEFNRRNPDNPIEYNDIYNSITKQAETRASARAGYAVNEKNFRIAKEIVEANEKTLREQAKK